MSKECKEAIKIMREALSEFTDEEIYTLCNIVASYDMEYHDTKGIDNMKFWNTLVDIVGVI